MRLTWRLYSNPISDSTSPLFLDLSRYTISQAQFSTYAQGGFGDGVLTITSPNATDVRAAAENWLMKRVEATDAEGRIAYEGFVSEVDAQSGYHHYWRSMDGFANRVLVWFRYAKLATGYPKCPKGSICVAKLRLDEEDVSALNTQTDLGIKEKWLDLTPRGRIKTEDAEQEGYTLLLDKLAARSIDTQLGRDLEAPRDQITLSLWGYYSTLSWREQYKAIKTSTDVALIIQQALSASNTAQFLSDDYAQIPLTGKSIKFNVDKKSLWLTDYIQGAIKTASPNNRALFFQVLEGRQAHLFTRSTSPRYFTRSDSNHIYNEARGIIPPYMVRAGGFVVAENADVAVDDYDDVLGRRYAGLVESTLYDDKKETIKIPPPSELKINVQRLLAKQKKKHNAEL